MPTIGKGFPRHDATKLHFASVVGKFTKEANGQVEDHN